MRFELVWGQILMGENVRSYRSVVICLCDVKLFVIGKWTRRILRPFRFRFA